MKKIFSLVAILCISLPGFATIWTVSNYPPLPAQYTDIGTAMGAATDGDTIYVHGSPNVYTGVWVTKRLTFIGAGYNPKTDFPYPSHVNEISPMVGGNGSTIMGFQINVVQTPGGSSNDTIKNITIRNCRIANLGTFTIAKNYENYVIENCFFNDLLNDFNATFFNPYQVGLIIRNCIFSDTRLQVVSGTIVDHCLFIGSNTSIRAFQNCTNSTFSNNIFVARNINATDAVNCIFNNNLTYNCSNNGLPLSGNIGSGNIINFDPFFMSHQVSPPTGLSFTDDYRLQVASPGYLTATDGTDLGVYGNNFTFSMTGEVLFIPVMRKLYIYNTTVPLNGTLDIRYKSSVTVQE